MKRVYINSVDELPQVMADLFEEFYRIDYSPMLVRELSLMADLHRDYFLHSIGPDGAPWKPNAPLTIARKGHRKVLFGIPSHGHPLFHSLTDKQPSDDAIRQAFHTGRGSYLVFGTRVPYSIFHDEPRGRTPARRHVGLTEKYVDQLAERVADYAVARLAE